LSLSNYIGLHAQWFDDLGQFGIIGITPYFIFLYSSFKDLYRHSINYDKKHVFFSLLIGYISFGFLNPIHSTSIYIIIFLLFPISNFILSKKTIFHQFI